MSIGQYLGGPNSAIYNRPNTDNSQTNTFSASGTGSNNNMTGIRNYLTSNGYNNNDIGYNNGNVTLQGHNFMQATPQAQDDLQNGMYKDSTYASPTALQGALGTYQNTFGNPNSDMTSNTGRTSAIGSLLNNQMKTINSQPFQFKQQQQPFSYDPNSDQAYQAALKSAQFNIGQSQGNTLANLAAHGQGNSSYAATAAQQIANQGMNNVSQNILPQLIQQAYGRYQDQNNNDYRNQQANYGVGQDQFKNQSALAGQLQGINQQDTQNQFTGAGLTGVLNGQQTMAGQQAQGALTGKLADGSQTYGAQQQDIQNAIARANAFGSITNQDDAKLLGVPVGTDTRALQALMYKNNYQNQMLGLKSQANSIAEQRANNQGGVNAARANYYNSQSANAKNTQANNNLESDVYSHSQDFQNAQDVNDYFNANGAYLAKNLGAKATNDLKNQFLAPYNQDNKAATSTYDKAFAAAQKDGDWPGLSNDDKNARIQQYQTMLANQ